MKRTLLIVFICSISFVAAFSQNTSDEKIYDSYKALVTAAKAEINQISIEDFHKIYTAVLGGRGAEFTLLDIRTESEHEDGFIPGSFLIQRGVLESRLEKDEVWEAFDHPKPLKSDTIILYCRSGSRSALAAKSLKMIGYTNMLSLEGGWSDWNEKYPNLKKDY